MKFRLLLLLTSLMLALSACSLADDIPPPAGYQSPAPQPTAGPVFPASAPNLASGAAIYVEKCAPCHGPSGMGDGPQAAKLPKKPTLLGDATIARAAVPANWYTIVTQGRIDNFMPPFNSLNDQQRWDVVAYALSLSATPGKTVYESSCVECHGVDGKKSAKSDFTDQARMAKLSVNELASFINKGVDTMPAYEGKLSEVDVFAAADYIRTFTWSAAAGATPSPEPVSASGTLVATEAAASPAQTPGTLGTISGKITNKSAASLPTDLKVVLHIYEHDAVSNQFSELDTKTTMPDAEGQYSFGGLAMPSNYAFYISVDHASTTYSSEPIVPTADVKTYDLPLDIYDTTSDLTALVADQVHIILDYSKPDVIQVVELFTISNLGTKAVIPASKGAALVNVTLPKGFSDLQFQDGAMGERYIQTADGFGDTSSIAPSKEPFQLIFAYNLPASASFDFVQPFSLNVSTTQFLVSEGVKALAPGILDGGLKDMGSDGGKYQLYNVGAYKAGESMKVAVSGTPSKPLSAAELVPGNDTTRNLIIGVGVLGLALMLVAVLLILRDRKRSVTLAFVPVSTGMTRDEIVDAIVALDDQHNAGNISQEAYQQRRAELKEQFQDID